MEPTSKESASPQLIGILNSPTKHASQGSSNLQPTTISLTILPSGHRPSSTNLAVKGPLIKTNINAPTIPITATDQRPVPILQNVVGTVNLGCELDLLKITVRTRNSEYNPARFSGVVMRIREPRTTALLFRSGKMVITGAKSEQDCNLAARKFARILQKLGFPARFINFRVINMVATCDLKFPIRVENLNMMHGQFSSYEPELFPGLIYRMVHPRVVLLIFCNGKICFTGAKTQDELNEALENIFPILKSFKKQ